MSRLAIQTSRFMLRELSEADVTVEYLRWLDDAGARRFIQSAAGTRTLDDLRNYVCARTCRDDVLFLGIFDVGSGAHLGNIKFEPLDSARGYAVMGILVGDAAYRGKGVAREVLGAMGEWLKQHRGIGEIVLGVDKRNTDAVRAYEKTGFRVEASAHLVPSSDDVLVMVWRP